MARDRTSLPRLLGAALGLAALATPVLAQTSALTGSWRGLAMGVTFNLVVAPNQSFSEQQIGAGGMTTLQQGRIVAAGPGEIAFVVEDWAPKTMPVYHPTGTTGGYYTQQPTAKPPGGTWRVSFNGPATMTLQDVNLGGAITFQRVR